MIVVKIGGSIADDCPALLDEVTHLPDVVLVHGFGPQTDQVIAERSLEPREIRSPEGVTSRYTDDAVIAAMQEAAGRVQRGLADELSARGAQPDRIGHDVPLVWGEAKPVLRHERRDGRVVLVRGNRSGRVEEVYTEPIEDAIEEGRVPIVTPLALDGEGLLSVDADRAAAAIAGDLNADALVLCSDVPGLLRDPEDLGTRVDELAAGEIDAWIGEHAGGGMVRKLVACREALEAGAGRALIADGRREAPLDRARSGDATEVTR